MAEYIEKEALMRRIKEIHCAECDNYHGVRCRACWVDDTLDYIDSEPAADVECGGRLRGVTYEDGKVTAVHIRDTDDVVKVFVPVQHGRWLGWGKGGTPTYENYGTCSVCGEDAEIYTEHRNYCPNCGGKLM